MLLNMFAREGATRNGLAGLADISVSRRAWAAASSGLHWPPRSSCSSASAACVLWDPSFHARAGAQTKSTTRCYFRAFATAGVARGGFCYKIPPTRTERPTPNEKYSP
eukprot:75297-Chlamydomonas_euryale.AAC.5